MALSAKVNASRTAASFSSVYVFADANVASSPAVSASLITPPSATDAAIASFARPSIVSVIGALKISLAAAWRSLSAVQPLVVVSLFANAASTLAVSAVNAACIPLNAVSNVEPGSGVTISLRSLANDVPSVFR